MSSQRVLIIAGGTGGHIFPALAVARELRKRGFDLWWMGSQVGMESELVGDEFPMSLLSIKAIRGKGLLSKISLPWRLCRATWQAWRLIKQWNPDVVLGMGGFVSGPGGIATWLARKPLVIHEQNAIAGMTNRLLSKRARVVLQAFPNAFSSKIAAKTVGNPVRPTISELMSPEERFKDRTGPLRILIVGGSRGARAINQSMLRVLTDYPESQAIRVWHQTGQLDFNAVQKAYDRIVVPATVEAFIDDMAAAYAWADLMICRAGALTISEIAIAGVPSILIPFPYAVDDHQYHNGIYLSDSGAAELIRQSDLTDDRLTRMIQRSVKDRSLLLAMSAKAKLLAKPQALAVIADVCEQLAQ